MRGIIFAVTICVIMVGFIKYLDLKEQKENRNYTGENLLSYIEKIDLSEYKIQINKDKKIKNFIILLSNDNSLTHFIKVDKCIKSQLKNSDNIPKIETYIVISTEKYNVGTYDSGAGAYRMDYNISFLDVNSKTIFYQSKIVGHQPKDTIYRKYNLKESDELGKLPTDDTTCYTIEKLINQINHIQ